MDFITILALIVASMLKYSAPLIFTSIGGTFSERGGIVNVGLEGIMVIGAFAGVLFNLNFADSFGDATPWIAAIVAVLLVLFTHCSTRLRPLISVRIMLSLVRY